MGWAGPEAQTLLAPADRNRLALADHSRRVDRNRPAPVDRNRPALEADLHPQEEAADIPRPALVAHRFGAQRGPAKTCPYDSRNPSLTSNAERPT